MSILRNLLILAVAAFTFGCSTSNPYKKKNGCWEYDGYKVNTEDQAGFEVINDRFARDKQFGYYRGGAIENSDGKSFSALNDHYSKDGRAVYFCDTYRKGQEYYMTKYNRIIEVQGADPATFRFFKDAYGYMRDDKNLFSEGRLFKVKDINSFHTLENSFDRDDVSGYYNQVEIIGSDGKTFRVLDNHYSCDTNHVYYSDMEVHVQGQEFGYVTIRVKGASPASFSLLKDGYAKDDKQLYFYGKLLTANLLGFEVLGNGYAKNSTEVFYYGTPLKGADAHSFSIFLPADDFTDASDKKGKFLDGKRVKL